MQLANVPENRVSEMLFKFLSESCFTFEGIDLSTKQLRDNFKKEFEKLALITGGKKGLVGYMFTGKMMNETFSLTGSNAYPEDLTFCAIPEYYNPEVKLRIGARWFDDIVASNAIKQNAIVFKQEADFA